ncbi:MAG: ABC transporter permease [Solirubrobacterales bacterium]|nr:ABC transporter permease [Solirubrobacterales bacterium]
MTTVIARHHIKALRRQKTFVLMLSVLLLMTAVSGYIGWSTHSTILRIYEETVATLSAAGMPAPPNPFDAKPRLSLLNNMVIYVPLIGSLMAILLGHVSMMGDRQAGVTRIIFSRPVGRSSYFWGKAAGSAIALAAIMVACLALSTAGLTLVNGNLPSVPEFIRLVLFFVLSGTYLLVFTLVGAITALLVRSQSLALLAGVAIWVIFTFATPELTSGLRPVASLNPVTDPVTVSASPFFRVTSKAKPVSVNEQYKALSTSILSDGSHPGAAETVGRLAPIVAVLFLLGGGTRWLVGRHDFSEEAARD